MKKAITILFISLLSCISIHTPFARTIKGKGFDKDSIPYSKDEQRGITTMDLLTKYKWKHTEYNVTRFYTQKFRHLIFKVEGYDTLKDKQYFYLSKRKVRRFNKKKVGFPQNGKYIVTDIGGDFTINEILEISDTSLITREMRFGTIAKYKAMPK